MKAASPSFMEIEFTIALPWMHLRPASITWNFEESTITGTRAMSGSAAIRLRNSTIAFSESSRPSSMLTSMICAPFATWSRATSSAAAKSPLVMSLRNLAEPVTFVRSPTFTKGMSDVSEKGSRPESRMQRLRPRAPARRLAGDRFGDGADMLRRGAAAAADDVDEAGIGELRQHRGRRLRALVVEAELVGQARIRIGADQRVGHLADLLDMRPHLARAERAIEADGERLRVAHRMPERRRGLAGQGAAGQIGDRAGDHHGSLTPRSANTCSVAKIAALAFSVSKIVSMRMSSAPPSIEAAHLLGVGVAHLVEGDGAISRDC